MKKYYVLIVAIFVLFSVTLYLFNYNVACSVAVITSFDWVTIQNKEYLSSNAPSYNCTLNLVDINLDGNKEIIITADYPPREVPVSEVFAYSKDGIKSLGGFWGNPYLDHEVHLYKRNDKLFLFPEIISTHGGIKVDCTIAIDTDEFKNSPYCATVHSYDSTDPTLYYIFEPPFSMDLGQFFSGGFISLPDHVTLVDEINFTSYKHNVLSEYELYKIVPYQYVDNYILTQNCLHDSEVIEELNSNIAKKICYYLGLSKDDIFDP